jgi:hypothetical protein
MREYIYPYMTRKFCMRVAGDTEIPANYLFEMAATGFETTHECTYIEFHEAIFKEGNGN